MGGSWRHLCACHATQVISSLGRPLRGREKGRAGRGWVGKSRDDAAGARPDLLHLPEFALDGPIELDGVELLPEGG